MTSLTSKAWLCALLLPALVSCSSPSPTLYTISPINGREQMGARYIIGIERIALARYLDRSEVVRSTEGYRLVLMPNDWWGEPLGAMLRRVLASELQQRLPGSTVIDEMGAVSVPANIGIALDIQRLDENAPGQVVLRAQVALHRKGASSSVVRMFRFSATSPSTNADGEVAAISSVVGQLADALALLIVQTSNRA